MNLIKVEYIEESTEAAFFLVTFEKRSFFGKNKQFTKRALLRRSGFKSSPFVSFPEWADTGETFLEGHVSSEMILQYENR